MSDLHNVSLVDLKARHQQWEDGNRDVDDKIAKTRAAIVTANQRVAYCEQQRQQVDASRGKTDWLYEKGTAQYDKAQHEKELTALRAEREQRRPAIADVEAEIIRRKDAAADMPIDFFDTTQDRQVQRDWLVEGLLVQGENCLLGGPRKSLKTAISLDLALSIASGTPFLGRFPVLRPGRVAFLSGESGKPTIVETARRIAASKGIADVATVDVCWGLTLPTVDKQRNVTINGRRFKDALAAIRPTVCIIDPLYVCLADRVQLNTANLFEVGPVLSALVEACRPATPILVHHATKFLKPGKPMALESMAFAGFQEWARQWLLINRRKPFRVDQPTDLHKLIVSYGGSAGHNGCFNLDVNEGRLRPDWTGRVWSPSVMTGEEATTADKEATVAARQTRKNGTAAINAQKLLAVLPADGSLLTVARTRAATKLGTEALNAAIAAAGDRVEVVSSSRGTRTGRSLRLKVR